ncbi:heparan sulfate glucosamine 3-O-sulfotransferase 1-like [Babylonia areolata]|uniref:heparan sulfate glucosamine 3-O-sulfotransferase 1-like n=1 Tax=Babylonia areolata TaxID=304850 RepID=UPI003FD0B8BB
MVGGVMATPKYQRLPQDPPDLHPLPSTPHTPPHHSPPGQLSSHCPKLSRYKMVAAMFVVVVTMVVVAVTCLQWRHPYLLQHSAPLSPPSLRPEGDTGRKCNGMAHLRYSHTKRQLPQCLIIGARKAGTRALLYFLNRHSQIQTAGREIHFFDKNFHLGLDWYRRQMPFSFKDQVTMEKTPAYFVEAEVPKRVHSMNHSMKLLLILRDPIDRTMSDYLQIMDNKVKRHKPQVAFEKLVLDQETYEINRSYSAIRRSIYVRHLQRWLEFFPLSQIHLVDGENLVAHPWQELAKVESFLGLEHQITRDHFTFNTTRGFYCFRTADVDIDSCLSKDKGRSHPSIDPYVLKKLIEFFTPFNHKLFNLIGRRFHWQHWT